VGAVPTLPPGPPAHLSRRQSAPPRAAEVRTAAAVSPVRRPPPWVPKRRASLAPRCRGRRRCRRAALHRRPSELLGSPQARRRGPVGHRLRRRQRRLSHGHPRPLRQGGGQRRRGSARARLRCGPPPRPRRRPVGQRRGGLQLLRVAAAAALAMAAAAIFATAACAVSAATSTADAAATATATTASRAKYGWRVGVGPYSALCPRTRVGEGGRGVSAPAAACPLGLPPPPLHVPKRPPSRSVHNGIRHQRRAPAPHLKIILG